MKTIIERAYLFSKKLHKGQKRPDGSDYFKHLEKVVGILRKKEADDITISAALLHDTLEDTSASLKEIEKSFGKEVSFLVDGMTKIKGDLDATFKKFEEYAKKDKRILLIKLADLEENLSMLNFEKVLSKDKIKRKYLMQLDIISRLDISKKEWANEILKKANKIFSSWKKEGIN